MGNGKLSRRTFITSTGIATLASAVTPCGSGEFAQARTDTDSHLSPGTGVPRVLHQTDLFHEHGDPDDHFDLATLFALQVMGKIDLVGVVLDYPPAHRKGDPGVLPLAQMNRMCGTAVPAAVGTSRQMAKPFDSLPDLPRQDSAAINLILKTLRESDRPVALTCAGSATDIAAASLREPDLFRNKCSKVYLNAGGAFPNPDKPDMLEFNARLNPLAYQALFSLPCPLCWFPCWHTVEIRKPGERGTFYWLPHEKVFEGISSQLKNYFLYMFDKSGSTKWLAALNGEPDPGRWRKILKERRGMWSTASILDIAGLAVSKEGELLPKEQIDAGNALYGLDQVDVSCGSSGRTEWKPADSDSAERTNERLMFHLFHPDAYPGAMAQAVNTLFKVFGDL